MSSIASASSAGTDTISGYAHAILEVARAEGAVERVEDELYQFARTLEANSELRERLSDESLLVAGRIEVISELLGGKAHPQTVSAVSYVVQAGRGRVLLEIADETARLAAEARKRVVAEVRSAVALDDAQQSKIAAALTQSSGKDVELKVTVDPKVVGGLVIKMGDTVIDGSVARRLSELRARLTGG
ncbi:MAG TPA: ATP synthase F1 subunit delta [Egibacteraceae bacterium]|nr:ATP synthase F1 subunit delta [Egibacteraceae bacterium]